MAAVSPAMKHCLVSGHNIVTNLPLVAKHPNGIVNGETNNQLLPR